MLDLFDLIESAIWLGRRWVGRLLLLAVVVTTAGAVWLGWSWGLAIGLFVAVWLFGLFGAAHEAGSNRRREKELSGGR